MAERLRLGRHHKDTVYQQLGDEPSNDDPRIAVFIGPAAAQLAAAYVAQTNALKGPSDAETH